MSQQHVAEVAAGERFEFGKNWARFLEHLDEDRIVEAERSLVRMLECQDLRGLSFLDIGSGSGLFSLAARRLGASVFSFDYDPHSVACTRELRRRYFDGDLQWTVASGSILDATFLATLGRFDVVYSWGVLHHTGQMWNALENAGTLVAPGGKLFIALYNDEGGPSRRWTWVKRTYCQKPYLRWLLVWASFWKIYWKTMLKDLLLLRPGHVFRNYRHSRGMTLWRDLIDWVGGYPFEVSTPRQVFDFYRQRGFSLSQLNTTNDSGCNEFVFTRDQRP
jgi:2-polyprenyl-6-hydroxyphenyl methylase/3-demethylubiquinone-9 3-methyltransferase